MTLSPHMLDVLIDHADGVEVPYVCNTARGENARIAAIRRQSTGALILRQMIRPNRPDRPQWTVITPRGREHLRRALAEIAGRLARAHWDVAPPVDDSLTGRGASCSDQPNGD